MKRTNIKIITWDIDKTLTNETCWTKEDCLKATPNEINIAKLKEDAKTNWIVIYTARAKELAVETLIWLERNGLSRFPVKFEKLPADEYKDDKAFNINDKNNFLKILNK